MNQFSRNLLRNLSKNFRLYSDNFVIDPRNNVGRYSINFVRFRHSARINTGVVFVPQQEAWIIERMGRYNRTLG